MNKNVTNIQFHPRVQMHAAFLVGTLCTAGLLAPVWIIWAIATRNKQY